MKLNRKFIRIKTIAVSMLKILINSSKQNTGYMAISPTPANSESQANPDKQDLKEKKRLDIFMKKD